MFLKEQLKVKVGGGGCEDEWIVLAPHLPWCLTVTLLRKETDQYTCNFVLNLFLSIRPVLIS